MSTYTKKLSPTKVGVLIQALFDYCTYCQDRIYQFPSEMDDFLNDYYKIQLSISFHITQYYQQKQFKNQSQYRCSHPTHELLVLKNVLLEYNKHNPVSTEFGNLADMMKNDIIEHLTNTVTTVKSSI